MLNTASVGDADLDLDDAAFSDYNSETEDELDDEKNNDSDDDDVIMNVAYMDAGDVTLGFE